MKDYSLRNEKSRLIQASATSLHEHITELFENGYDQGYADAKFELGQNAIDLAHEESDRAYQQGLEDAWEAAKKIHDGQIPYKVFGLDKTGNGFTYASPLNWGENMSSSEAIAKIKEYEEKQKHTAHCPFCGGDMEIYCEENMYKQRCKNTHTCGCQIALWFDEPEDAVKAWNER